MSFRFVITAMILSCLMFPSLSEAGKTRIKYALLAPEGTSWANSTKVAFNKIEEQTGGALDMKLYAGGKQGDENEVLQKIRINHIHGAAFTSVALTQIVPEFQILGLPGLIQNYEELDYVTEKTTKFFEDKFLEKGFVFLGWAEVGPIYVFTNVNAQYVEEFKGVKMWAMPGEPITPMILEKNGMKPITVPITDVLLQLEAGALDGFANTPMGAIGFQWFRKAKYVGDQPILYSTGGVLLTRQIWDSLTTEQQTIVKKSLWELSVSQKSQMRKENEESFKTLQDYGIGVLHYAADSVKLAEEQNLWLRQKIVADGQFFTADFLKEIEGYIQEVRSRKKSEK
ncbi:MAG: TRAP transporter substrate-binding protein DctP [SAR324 cluster bacterium]|nr:TRAP transporter substrate-binding protein DctP [SAR324 cluster bacterium]